MGAGEEKRDLDDKTAKGGSSAASKPVYTAGFTSSAKSKRPLHIGMGVTAAVITVVMVAVLLSPFHPVPADISMQNGEITQSAQGESTDASR